MEKIKILKMTFSIFILLAVGIIFAEGKRDITWETYGCVNDISDTVKTVEALRLKNDSLMQISTVQLNNQWQSPGAPNDNIFL